MAAQRRLRDQLLPGPACNSNYIVTMQYVVDAIGEKFGKPDYARYRKIQILASIEKHGLAGLRSGPGAELWRRLTRREKTWAMRLAVSSKILPKRFDSTLRKLDQEAFAPTTTIQAVGEYTKISEVCRALEARAVV